MSKSIKEIIRDSGDPDPWYTKSGKVRTWSGHLRVLSKLLNVSYKKLKERFE